MKNDIFNFNRFGKYFTTDLRSCWANYGLSLLCLSLLSFFIIYLGSIILTVMIEGAWSGPGFGLRAFTFCVIMFCIAVTMPVKCYGKITEKQYGSFWLNVPASRLEKFICMIINTCIIAPVIGAGLFIATDTIVCAIDHTCGQSIISGAEEALAALFDFRTELEVEIGNGELTGKVAELVDKLCNPLLYIDDMFCMILPFLLGAIFFKTGKTVKTFIALAIFSTAVSMISLPIMVSFGLEMSTQIDAGMNDDMALEWLMNQGFFKHAPLWDTLSDIIMTIALMIGIWFRIKTLKH